ncbi:Uncharacterized protein TCM_035109 [Theobroma cacao]|uniref:Uncharacterized protein n=1 Tax=Theobroma cacao TaxID=3641 RepID=A0A061FP41_THECC|nr:Uncharacterized protein TCM_035109 [Theobroma cacao]
MEFCLINRRYRIINKWDNIHEYYSFGYDSINDDYKIIKVAQKIELISHALISKENRVKESWTKLCSFQERISLTRNLYTLRPLAYSRTCDQLLLHQEGLSLLGYDLKEKKFKDVDHPLRKNVKAFFVEICVESLIKLDEPIIK